MFKGLKFIGAIAVIACAFGAPAFAQDACKAVTRTTGEVEQEVVNAKGEKTKTLVPASKVVPGTEVIWTITVSNPCKKPLDKPVINDPVPEHMSLVPGSVIGAGSDVTYSVDGKTFATFDKLTVTQDGATRPARPEDIKQIRWEFHNSLQPGASAFGRFRAVLN